MGQIPNNLLDKIEKGIARSRTATLGLAGNMFLPVNQNTYVVVYHVQYQHFFDTPLAMTLVSLQLNTWHQLTLHSRLSSNRFMIRQDFYGTIAANFFFPKGSTPIDMYSVHESPGINFDIMKAGGITFNNQLVDVPDGRQNDAKVNTGYGNETVGRNTVRLTNSNFNTQYYPATKEFGNAGAPYPPQIPGQDEAEQFFVDDQSGIAAQVQIEPGNLEVVDGFAAMRMPLINVSYVEVNKQRNETVQGS